jgi:molecular chaperone HscC
MIVGIDLGTTNSLVGVFRDGQPQLIANALGHVLTPSAVACDEAGHLLVGLPARELGHSQPQRVASVFKRWMGTDKSISLGPRRYRPEELSSLVLKALKADAEAFLGEPVTEAVITVPAYFNQAQRQATKIAGELAGLRVERLLNEPTAAGLAYGLTERAEHSSFLVFDLGGGTFDVSVLEYFEGVVEVRASAGDTQLGGEDFNEALVQLFLARQQQLDAKEREQLLAQRALWRPAEQAKRDLSQADSTVMRLVWQGRSLEQAVSRQDFETACQPLLERLRQPIERALMDARLQPGELGEVVLVGGATRMPMVRQAVTRLFQKLPLRTINPDEVVARGAAVQAGLKSRDAALDEVVLTDVMPFSLGVVTSEQVGGRRIFDRFSPIIERNTPVPVSRMNVYSTVEDNQAAVVFDIRQGESPVGSENLKLGQLEVSVPRKPAGQVVVQVRFSYDANGLLAVDAREQSSGQPVGTVIQQRGSAMTEDQVREALARLEKLKVHPREQQENVYQVERAKRLFADHLGDRRDAIAHALAQFEAVLDTQDERLVTQARQQFSQFLDHFDRGFVL